MAFEGLCLILVMLGYTYTGSTTVCLSCEVHFIPYKAIRVSNPGQKVVLSIGLSGQIESTSLMRLALALVTSLGSRFNFESQMRN